MATEQKLMTAEELFDMPDDGMDHELVRGELRTMPSPGFRHEETAAILILRFGPFVIEHELGRIVGGPGFRLERSPDTVRAPDFAFIAAGRIPDDVSPAGYLDFAPDLVVEVVSPSDRATDVQEKVEQWLQADARMVLLLYPATRSMAVYRSPSDIRLLGRDDVFDGGDVLPGFSCRVSDLFPV